MTRSHTGNMSAKTLITEFRARREAAIARRDLERQLAVYSSPAEIEDVLAAIESQTVEVTAEVARRAKPDAGDQIEHDDHPDANLVRDILTSNLAGSYRAHRAQRAPLSA